MLPLFNDRDMLGDCGVLPLRLQTVVSIELPEEIHGVLFCLGFSQEICGLRCNGPYAGAPRKAMASEGDAIPYCPNVKLAIPIAASMPAEVTNRDRSFFITKDIL